MRSVPSIRVAIMGACLGCQLATCVFAARPAAAENWPTWRGPLLNGVSGEKNLPSKWSNTENVRWRLELPGPAGASPVVWGDHIYLTTVDGEDLLLIAASTAGKELWRRKIGTGNKDVRGDEGNSASPSPVTDGDHVWTLMAGGELACFDPEGNAVWQANLQERYGKFDIQFGMTSTPVLDGDRLFLQLIHSGGAQVVALNKLSGEELWKQKRPSDAKAECEHSYASPVVYRDDARSYLLTHGADYIVAHRLDDGQELWRCGGLNLKHKYNPTLRFVATPACVPGLIVVPSAKNGPVLGLKPDGQGDLTDKAAAQFWARQDNTPDVPSPVIYEDLVYLCRENGDLLCLDAKTGQEKYLERTHRMRHRASPVAADGKLYLAARDGLVSVVKTGPKFELLAQNELGEDISSSPAVSQGVLYLRTFSALYAIGN